MSTFPLVFECGVVEFRSDGSLRVHLDHSAIDPQPLKIHPHGGEGDDREGFVPERIAHAVVAGRSSAEVDHDGRIREAAEAPAGLTLEVRGYRFARMEASGDLSILVEGVKDPPDWFGRGVHRFARAGSSVGLLKGSFCPAGLTIERDEADRPRAPSKGKKVDWSKVPGAAGRSQEPPRAGCVSVVLAGLFILLLGGAAARAEQVVYDFSDIAIHGALEAPSELHQSAGSGALADVLDEAIRAEARAALQTRSEAEWLERPEQALLAVTAGLSEPGLAERAERLLTSLVEQSELGARRAEALAALGDRACARGEHRAGWARYREAVAAGEAEWSARAAVALGDSAFDQQHMNEAIRAYQSVGGGEDELRLYARYKLAWCLYNVGESIKGLEHLEAVAATSSRPDLVREARRDAVVFLSDGPASAARPVLERLCGQDGGCVAELTERLRSLYRDRGDETEAAAL